MPRQIEIRRAAVDYGCGVGRVDERAVVDVGYAVRVVCVTWTDAHGNAFSVYEAHEVPHCAAVVRTYGVLLREDDAGISIANEVFEAGSFRGVTFIPRGMIQSVDDVRSSRRRAKVPQVQERPRQDAGID